MPASRSTTPPCWFLPGLAFVCFFRKLTRSTIAVPLVLSTRRTFPRLPASRPERTTTVSPFLTCGFAGRGVSFCFSIRPYMTSFPLDDFRSEGDDLHELPLAELAGNGADHAGADRLARVVDENGRVVVEFDVGTVATAGLFHRPHDDGLDDGPLLHGSVRRRFLDRRRDDVAQPGVAAGGRAAAHLDA